jgi:o-succinylbenzoate synthase
VRIQVVRVDLFKVRMPLVHEFETSSHRKGWTEHVLVKMTDSEGVVGWGESASPSDPYFCGENVDTCWLMLERYLVPGLLGKSWHTPADAAGFARIKDNGFARAATDMACWDLYSRHRGQPLAQALGGEAETIEAGVSLGIEPTVDALLQLVALYVKEGYRRVKLKITPGWEVVPCEEVLGSFPGIVVQVDGNGAFSPHEHQEVFSRLDELGLGMIEQPFAADDLTAHAQLQRSLSTPVCLDESITSDAVLRTALTLGACRVVNVKVSRLGGLGPARKVHDVCLAAGVPAWCGGMHELGVGRAANVALASLPGFVLPSDVSGSAKYYEQDVVSPPIVAEGGKVRVPRSAPGLGHEVMVDVVESHLTGRATLGTA